MGAPVNPSFVQQSFRFRNDNGSQTTATWAQSANVNDERSPFIIFRCRFLIQQTVSTANTNLTRAYKLRYSLNGGTYTDVAAQNSSDTPIRYADSSNIADDESTTQQLGTGTFVTGQVDENGATGNINFTSGALSETEVEFVLELNSVSNGDTLDLGVYETNNTVLATYTTTARVTALVAGRARRIFVMG